MSIILLGFMGTGKSTVGRQLARREGRPFVDVDAYIEKTAGMRIREIFSREGEAGFRKRERTAVAKLSRLREVVLAVGGGAWLDPVNRKCLQDAGRCIALWARPEVLAERLEDHDDRPLLDGSDRLSSIKDLLAERRSAYEQAHAHIETSDRSPEEVVAMIPSFSQAAACRAERPKTQIIRTERPYPVVTGAVMDAELPVYLQQVGLMPGPVGLAADHLVDSLYGDKTKRVLQRAGYEVFRIRVRVGEGAKTLSQLQAVYDQVLGQYPDRQYPLLALGGGVTGDLIGFAAATLLRGVPYVQLPTTLLAQVDSSVGGKVAVNHSRGKNLIGAFYQPHLVFMDVDKLGTLGTEEFSNGMGEVLKHALLSNGDYRAFLRENERAIRERDPSVLGALVRASCRIKADHVAADEREAGRRMFLNLGHTTAHAVEAASDGQIAHGRAVGFGLAVAARLSEAMLGFSAKERGDVEALLNRWGFPLTLSALEVPLSPDAVWWAMRGDKKRRGAKLTWVLLQGLGQPVCRSDVPRAAVMAAMKGAV